jgi:hypothetical protein
MISAATSHRCGALMALVTGSIHHWIKEREAIRE